MCTLSTVQVASRTMWSHLVEAGPTREAAYSYEAVSFELCWLLGPVAASLIATTFWPGSALLIASVVTTFAALSTPSLTTSTHPVDRIASTATVAVLPFALILYEWLPIWVF